MSHDIIGDPRSRREARNLAQGTRLRQTSSRKLSHKGLAGGSANGQLARAGEPCQMRDPPLLPLRGFRAVIVNELSSASEGQRSTAI